MNKKAKKEEKLRLKAEAARLPATEDTDTAKTPVDPA